MKYVTRQEAIGEWLGDVPDGWDYGKFYTKHLSRNETWHNESVQLFKQISQALKDGKDVYAEKSGGFVHKVYSCGLYDGWPFWEPRPCYSYKGPLPCEHIGEYYDLIGVKINEKAP